LSDAWAKFCVTPASTGAVVSLHQARAK